jgi:HAD superfamily hydrolase (TIGR01450 family)
MGKAAPSVVGTVIVDLDGVIYHGNQGLPGAGPALQALSDMGWRVVMATNNSSKTPADVVEKIQRLTGYVTPLELVVTSAQAAAANLAGNAETALIVGEAALEEAVSDAGIEVVTSWQHADAVVVGVDFGISYDKIDQASRAIRGGAIYLATNTDANFPTPDGLAVGSGAIVGAITIAAGVQPVVCGKPEQPMRTLIKQRTSGRDIWVIGDRPETDIAMAAAEGWRSILPLTGVTTAASSEHAVPVPDFVVASVADVPDIIGRHSRGSHTDER